MPVLILNIAFARVRVTRLQKLPLAEYTHVSRYCTGIGSLYLQGDFFIAFTLQMRDQCSDTLTICSRLPVNTQQNSCWTSLPRPRCGLCFATKIREHTIIHETWDLTNHWGLLFNFLICVSRMGSSTGNVVKWCVSRAPLVRFFLKRHPFSVDCFTGQWVRGRDVAAALMSVAKSSLTECLVP